jgi:hypothetical protein
MSCFIFSRAKNPRKISVDKSKITPIIIEIILSKSKQLDTRRKESMFPERIETFMVKFQWMLQQKTTFKNRRR